MRRLIVFILLAPLVAFNAWAGLRSPDLAGMRFHAILLHIWVATMIIVEFSQ